MFEWLTGKFTYSNVVSTLCLFLLLGGGAYAATQLPKNSVGTKQLKRGAVTGGKIRANAVTGAKVADGSLAGADIAAATLGQVPSAVRATTATRSTQADRADFAAGAASAVTAGDAARLNGRDAFAYRDRCEFSQQVGWDVCVSDAGLDPSVTWEEAVEECSFRRLPGVSEAMHIARRDSVPEGEAIWTDTYWTDEGVPKALAVSWTNPGGLTLEIEDADAEIKVRCVTVLSNALALAPEPQPAAD
jgi:hypothetical protein